VQSAAVTEFLLPRLQDGFPILASMLAQEQYEDGLDDDVDFGLHRILDGIEQLVSTGRYKS
jgi:hypothetical protein